MSTLVERLREQARLGLMNLPDGFQIAGYRESADLIEQLTEALEGLLPGNLGSLPATMPDTATLSLDVTFGELRKARAALAKARGE